MIESDQYPVFFARFYDTIYDQVRDSTDHRYFINKILETKGPVLEIGVGTGRLFTDALSQGANIYGIDFSPSMIQVLKAKLPTEEHHRIHVDDIRYFQMNQKFSLIIAPFRVFMHLLSVNDQIKALNNVYRHLDVNGKFIFDLFVPNLKMLHEGIDNRKDFEGEYEPGKRLVRYSSMTADPVCQITEVTFKLVWDEDGEQRKEVWKTKMRYFFKYEIEHLIKLSKLSQLDIYGDFDENMLARDSREFVIICTKRS
jgi:SAM-dependent methyltransferase